MYNPFSLEGKTILVVGASSGIGRATAIECSKMGANLILSSRNDEKLRSVAEMLEGDGHQVIPADITNEQDLNNLVDTITRIDGLVLSSGRGTVFPIPFCSREKFDYIFNLNFFALCELTRLIYKKKKINSGGSIVFISSVGGIYNFAIGNSMYGCSKAALNSFMCSCALEFSARKIRVNSVNPAMVHTPLIESGEISAEQLKIDEQKYPLKRYGEPNDISHGIVYLLSDASSWVTGHSLVIDGGICLTN